MARGLLLLVRLSAASEEFGLIGQTLTTGSCMFDLSAPIPIGGVTLLDSSKHVLCCLRMQVCTVGSTVGSTS